MTATGSLTDCARLVTAVQEAGGRAPKPLTNILAGAALLKDHSAPGDPAKAIVNAAVVGQLTEQLPGELRSAVGDENFAACAARVGGCVGAGAR
jgi:hypothetical protein